MTIQPNGNAGYGSFDGGQNEGSLPILLSATQTQKNVNVTLKNRSLKPRPAKADFDFKFLPEALGDERPALGSLTYKHNFLFGRVQHSGKFQTSQGEYLLRVINGIIYVVDLYKKEVRVVEIAGFQKLINYNLTRINGTQSKNDYVLFDWPAPPIVISSEFKAVRAKESNQEIPRSYIGTHVHGRLFVGNAGVEFGASDLRSLESGSIITFKDSIVAPTNPSPPYPNQFFELDYIDKLSSITAMGFFQQFDGSTPLGFGPLFVSTKEAIHLVMVNQPRAQWSQTPAFVRAIVYNYGIVGPKAFVNVGQDIFYKSFDGDIYTTGMLSGDQQKWGTTHISTDIQQSLNTQNQHLLKYSVLEYFENRVFVTLRPYIVQALSLFGKPIEDYVSNSLGVLEFNNISSLLGNSPPVWAGVYSGAFSDILVVDDKLIVCSKSQGVNIISELSEHRTLDSSKGIRRKIKSRIYTREFDFQTMFLDKKIRSIQLGVRRILGDFTANIYYRLQDQDPWTLFGNIYYTPKTERRGTLDDESVFPPDSMPTVSKSMQFRIDVTGEDWEITHLLLWADILTEPQPKREYDTPRKWEVDFKDVGDSDL